MEAIANIATRAEEEALCMEKQIMAATERQGRWAVNPVKWGPQD
jgi:hypothetical protein